MSALALSSALSPLGHLAAHLNARPAPPLLGPAPNLSWPLMCSADGFISSWPDYSPDPPRPFEKLLAATLIAAWSIFYGYGESILSLLN